MRVVKNFLAILTLLLLLSLPLSIAQVPFDDDISSRALDSVLQVYAFKAFSRPKTGVPYDAQLPHNLIGIKVSALRLRSGSLRTRGVQTYKEFQIPTGVVEQPYVERLVLVHHNLGNWSEKFYPLPGYTYLAPVLGLLSYSGVDLSAVELPELDIRASDKPILIKFNDVKSAQYGSVPKLIRIKKGMKIQELEWTADSNETLQMTSIGGTKAPLAIGTRTRPIIENDYIP
ncbi:hypothetical protein TSUD_124380 [Trifolium subterraneum]|uniref:Uncharacterized protein n=1 Tax=Trifolium subterraneum TaxID=3900 RepID=A0A2Z6MK67_TRISU|nr:hypothetical protein TSUD_124380 [Trifolium subterraneum]